MFVLVSAMAWLLVNTVNKFPYSMGPQIFLWQQDGTRLSDFLIGHGHQPRGSLEGELEGKQLPNGF